MDVVAGESPLTRGRLSVRCGELMVREDQIAATALDIESETNAAQRNRRAFDMPTRTPGAER